MMKAGVPRDLLRAAAAAARRAYAPYSKYRVGAAVRARDGRRFTGVNVENASYGLTLCAERVAVAAAVAAGVRDIVEVAVVATGPAWPAPCGACRQVLAEFAGPDTPVHTARTGRLSAVRTFTLGTLLPETFVLRPARAERPARGRGAVGKR